MPVMDSVDRSILTYLQYDFPLATRPFAAIARRLGIPGSTVIERIVGLKRNNVIRQISAIFDSSKIGYHSVLCAFKVDAKRLDSVARQINKDPGVSHNYKRSNEYNLWFTVTIPAEQDLKRKVAQVARRARVKDWLFLPAIKTYKIGFQLDMGAKTITANRKVDARKYTSVPARISTPISVDKAFVRELQKDLSLVANPYRLAAQELGWTEVRVVREIKRYLKAGVIRRVACVLRPVHAGYPENILTAWAPDIDKMDLLGRVAAQQKQVSHCYQRSMLPLWPYSVYTMVHGKNKAECKKVIRIIVRRSGVTRFVSLPTLKEYKKIRIEYFPH
jgi:siroheme decarboxylase